MHAMFKAQGPMGVVSRPLVAAASITQYDNQAHTVKRLSSSICANRNSGQICTHEPHAAAVMSELTDCGHLLANEMA